MQLLCNAFIIYKYAHTRLLLNRSSCPHLIGFFFIVFIQVTDSKDLQVPFSTAASLGYGLHHMLHLPPQFLHPLDHRLPFGGFRPLVPSAFAPPSKCLKVETGNGAVPGNGGLPSIGSLSSMSNMFSPTSLVRRPPRPPLPLPRPARKLADRKVRPVPRVVHPPVPVVPVPYRIAVPPPMRRIVMPTPPLVPRTPSDLPRRRDVRIDVSTTLRACFSLLSRMRTVSRRTMRRMRFLVESNSSRDVWEERSMFNRSVKNFNFFMQMEIVYGFVRSLY